ncbi:MAG: hypothetical protein NWF00_02125 [Candidatus Bathyarchaeota archaeon]|nr:hypothetical protein [Candidatus Bathyarchaeota archaeon]
MKTDSTPYSPLKIGLLIAALAWFLFSFHELFKGMVNIGEFAYFTGPTSTWILITDASGAVGLFARTIAALTALVAMGVYLAKKGLPKATTKKILQWILVIEAVYWLSLFVSGIWGILPADIAGFEGVGVTFNLAFLIETGLPCLIASIALPVALFKLAAALRPNKPANSALKWGLIAGTVYIFVFWLENVGNWIYTVMVKGTQYLTVYPENLLSFLLTTVGLLALAIYAAYFAKKFVGAERLEDLNLKTVGAIIVLVGLYYLWNYLTWIYFGGNHLWSDWYAWFLGHNMDLWLMVLPLVGLPLLFEQSTKKTAAEP